MVFSVISSYKSLFFIKNNPLNPHNPRFPFFFAGSAFTRLRRAFAVQSFFLHLINLISLFFSLRPAPVLSLSKCSPQVSTDIFLSTN